MKERLQASGFRHQGYGDETGVALADTKSHGEAPLPDRVVLATPAAVATGPRDLKPDACSLMPSAKADS